MRGLIPGTVGLRRKFVLVLIACVSLRAAFPEFAGPNGAVATVHPLAADAALAAVRRGGNAVDSAVAAALTLGVVDGHNSGSSWSSLRCSAMITGGSRS